MTVTAFSSSGTVSGRLDSWDERGCVVDGKRIEGPVCIDARPAPNAAPCGPRDFCKSDPPCDGPCEWPDVAAPTAAPCPRFLPALSGDWPWCKGCGKREYQHEEKVA